MKPEVIISIIALGMCCWHVWRSQKSLKNLLENQEDYPKEISSHYIKKFQKTIQSTIIVIVMLVSLIIVFAYME